MVDNPNNFSKPEQIFPLLARRLTPREKDVLQLIVGAHSVKEIARTLDIAPRTAEQHVINVKAKLLARSSLDVMRIVNAAEKLGYTISPDEPDEALKSGETNKKG